LLEKDWEKVRDGKGRGHLPQIPHAGSTNVILTLQIATYIIVEKNGAQKRAMVSFGKTMVQAF